MAGAGGDHDGRRPFARPLGPPARKRALLLASSSSSASSALLASGPATPEPGARAAAPMAGAGADRDGRLPLVLREPGQGLGRHHGPEARPLFGKLFGGRRGHEGASPAPAPAEAADAAAGAAAPAEPLDQLLGAGREGSPLGQGHITWRPPPAAGLAPAGGPPAPAAGGAPAPQMHPRGGGMAVDGAASLPRSPSPPPAPAASAGTPVATPHGGGCARTLGWPMDVYGSEAREARARSEGVCDWDDVARVVKLEDGGERGKSEQVCDWDDVAREVKLEDGGERGKSERVCDWDDTARVVQRRGVYLDKQNSRWKAQWYLQKGKLVHLGYFTSEAAAMRTYDRVALALKPGSETNFPSSDYTDEELAHLRSLPLDDVIAMARQRLLAGSPAEEVASEGTPVLQPLVSKRRGVTWHKHKSKCEVRLYHKGTNVYLGNFTSEAAAMRTYDRVALVIKPGAETNFPSSDYTEEELAHLRSLPLVSVISMAQQRLLAGSPAEEGTPVLQPLVSKRRGVYWNKQKSKWEAHCYLHKGKKYLGCFTSKAAAMRTHDRVALAARPGAETNFPSSDYTEEELARLRSLPLDDVIAMARERLLSGSPPGAAASAPPPTPPQHHATSAAESPTADAEVAAAAETTADMDTSAEDIDEMDSFLAAADPATGTTSAALATSAATGAAAASAAAVNAKAAIDAAIEPAPDPHSACPAPAAAAAPDDPASLLGRCVQRCFYPAGSTTPCWYEGRVSKSSQELGRDGSSVVPTWEVVYDDGDREVLGWEDLQAGLMPVAKRARTDIDAAIEAAAASARTSTTDSSVGVQTEPVLDPHSACPAVAAAAAAPDDPASLLGRSLQRSFFPAGSTTPCWYEGRVSSVRLELGGDGSSVVPAWEVVYDDGDREVLGWEDLQAGLMPVAKRARRDE